MPSERRDVFFWLGKRREVRAEELGKAKVGVLGVGGREGGCEDRAKKRKRDVRREVWREERLLGGKWVEWGVEGEWDLLEGRACRASISALPSGVVKTTLFVLILLFLSSPALLFSGVANFNTQGASADAGADTGRMNALDGNAGERWHCEVGVVMGESKWEDCRGEERDTMYACFVSFFPVVPSSRASMAASSLCTAIEKRRQKLGSCTISVFCVYWRRR